MLLQTDLKELAQIRLKDARILLASDRFDAAVYLCGYALELTLKLRICKTLDWDGFPSTAKEFLDYKSFKVHSLDILLHLSGYEKKVKTDYLSEWSIVNIWNPESRYSLSGNIDLQKAEKIINTTEELIEIL